MTELETLAKYENWKSAKRKRKFWINILAMLLGLLLAYIAVCLTSKVGIGNLLKAPEYSSKKIETKEEREQLPNDYLTWYKDNKMDESYAYKKMWIKEPSYFTYEEIAKRKAEKEVGGWLGWLAGKLASWLAKLGVPEDQKNQVDYVSYAQHVYSSAWATIFWGFPIFWIVFWLLLRYIVIPLCWKEPKLTEKK